MPASLLQDVFVIDVWRCQLILLLSKVEFIENVVKCRFVVSGKVVRREIRPSIYQILTDADSQNKRWRKAYKIFESLTKSNLEPDHKIY